MAQKLPDAETDAAAHRLAAEEVARAEAAKQSVEEELRKQAAKEAEKKKIGMKEQAGAAGARLPKRGTRDLADAVEGTDLRRGGG
jgi:hypothetical protein